MFTLQKFNSSRGESTKKRRGDVKMRNGSEAKCLFLLSLDSKLTHSELVNTVVVSVVTSILAITATLSNSVALYVFYRIRRLRTLSNMLLMSLCVTDLLTGVVVQPFFVVRRMHELNAQNSICTIRLIYVFFASLCAGASLLTLGLVTVDRCAAIAMPYRYLHIANYKLYMKLTTFVWLSWIIFVSLPFVNVLSTIQYNIGLSAIYLLVILLVLASYWRIYRIVIEQRRKIATVSGLTNPAITRDETSVVVGTLQNISIQERSSICTSRASATKPGARNVSNLEVNSEEGLKIDNRPKTSVRLQVEKYEENWNDSGSANLQMESMEDPTVLWTCSPFPEASRLSTAKGRRKKTTQRLRRFTTEQRQANTIAIVVVTLILCYLPQIVLLTIRASYGDNRDLLNIDAWADLLVFLNSSLNPLIYCHRNKDIRLALKSIFKRTLASQ